MKKVLLMFVVFLFLISCTPEEESLPELLPKTEVTKMKLTSSAFEHEGKIPSKYTCDGEDKSPPLKIEEVPEGAKSLVLIMDDPDAVKPAGKVWDHWIVFNIPVSTTEIAEGSEPAGVHGKGTAGGLSYQGPCPPDAEHRYYFKLYALKVELDLPEGSSKVDVENAMQGHITGQTVLMGRYVRG